MVSQSSTYDKQIKSIVCTENTHKYRQRKTVLMSNETDKKKKNIKLKILNRK